MAPQAEVRRVKSCAAQQEGGEVSNLFSWQSGRGKRCVSRPTALRYDNWKASCEALWDSKYHWWHLLVEKHSIHSRAAMFGNGLWFLLGRELKDPVPVVLGVILSHECKSPRDESGISGKGVKPVCMLLARNPSLYVFWVLNSEAIAAAGEFAVEHLCFVS